MEKEIQITKEVLFSLERELALSLVKWSKEKVSPDKAKIIANRFMANVDFSKPEISHKGINFYAREILNNLDFSELENL